MQITNLQKSIRIHPIFLLGVLTLSLSVGSILSQTLFTVIAATIGLSVMTSSLLWVLVAIIMIILGVMRSFEVGDDAE